MGVYIKGMEMPTDCDNCSLFDDRFDYPSCNVTGYSRGYNWNPRGQRMPDCPLIEVPPHGDLIDRDALRASFKESIYECQKWMNELNIETSMYVAARQALGTFVECSLRTKEMPTVIPADKDGEE